MANQVDIWYEACNLPQSVYDREFAFLDALRSRFSELSLPENAKECEVISEPLEGNPHRFFFFKHENVMYCGSKLISPLVFQHGSPGLFCSKIKAEMILGILERTQSTENDVSVYYRPLNGSQKRQLWSDIIERREIDFYFPYVHLSKETRQERTTPQEGWFITQERAAILGLGEVHLRAKSVQLLKELKLESPVVYDPACSTGEFLSAIKESFPNSKVIGQDMSAQMIEFARPRLDEVYVGDSIVPAPGRESVDVIFLRFLNGEVVSTEYAHRLFLKISEVLKAGGYLILFGHTPVLLSWQWIEEQGFEFVQRNAYDARENVIFQYYVAKKKKYDDSN